MKKNIFIKIFLAILIVALIGLVVFFYSRYQRLKNSGELEIKDLTGKISRFMVLPDEVPTIATVTDKNKLAEQPFFKNAEDGDKVLIFSTAAKAILFRPKLGKVIEVASIQSVSETTEVAPTVTPEKTVFKVALYNGTTTTGLASTVEGKIVSTFPEVSIIKKSNAVKKDYAETLVVDLTGTNSDLAIKIASSFGAKVTALPDGEKAPEADILLILGQKHP